MRKEGIKNQSGVVSIVVIMAICIPVLIAFYFRLLNNSSQKITKINELLNKGLPTKLGSFFVYDSAYYDGKTVIYFYSIAKDFDFNLSDTKHLWQENYEKLKKVYKYRILSVSDENIRELLPNSNIILRCYTPDGDFSEWYIAANEWKEFVKSTRGLRTQEAFCEWVKLEIDILNMYPASMSSTKKSLFDNCFQFQTASVKNDTVIFEYDTDENEFDLGGSLENNYERTKLSDEDILEILQDADTHYFLSLAVASHSSIIFRFVGQNLGKVFELLLPFKTLQQYCKPSFYSNDYSG